MRKIFIFVVLFLCFIGLGFSFDVLNQNGDVQSYFSLSYDRVIVESQTNLSSLLVSYEILNVSKTKSYNFSSCGSRYCLNFRLTDLIENQGGSLSMTTSFVLSAGSTESKTIYLDVEPPQIDVYNKSVDNANKQITLKFNYSDNSNQIDRIELYKKVNNSLTYLANVNSLHSYTYGVTKSGDYVFLFKIYDEAQNFRDVEETVEVEDIFKPSIDRMNLILNDGDYSLDFKVSDNNLNKYEVVQGSLVLSESLLGKSSYEKIVNLPFNSGAITLKVYDDENNVESKTIDLKSQISNSYYSKYFNSLYFEFKSNADDCYLTKVGAKSYSNKEFDKDSNKFSIKLDAQENENYNVYFFCVKGSFKEYFEREFFYDTKDPTESVLSFSTLDNGNIQLEWTESKDEESDVEYVLYRDDEKIYEGSKLKYEDKNVEYPNSYIYFVESYDEAGNTVESNEVSGVPKKVFIAYNSNINEDNLVVNNPIFNFRISTDVNSKVEILVKNQNKIIEEKSFNSISSPDLVVDINLGKGVNQILVTIVDEFSNSFEKTHFITYEPEVLSTSNQDVTTNKIEPKVEVVNTVAVMNSTPVNNSASTTANENNSDWVDLIWFVLFVWILVIFIWFIIVKDKYTRGKSDYKSKGKSQKLRKEILDLKSRHRQRDNILEKSFDKIKRDRIKRQEELRREAEKKKRLENRSRTELENQKLQDLAMRREINIPLEQRRLNKKRVESIKKEAKETPEESVLEKKKDGKCVKKKGWFAKKSKPQQDEFSNYINKVRSAPSWSNPRDYVNKEKPVLEPKDENLDLKDDKDLLQDKAKKADKKVPAQPKKKGFSFFKRKHVKEVPDFEDKKSQGTDSLKESVSENVVEEKKDKRLSKEDNKLHLDDYLQRAIRKRKKRNFYFAEREVDRDVRERK